MRLFLGLGNLIGRDICNLFWTLKAGRAARELKFDLIYGRGSPVCNLTAAARIKRTARVPLVLHFADPIPAPPEWQPEVLARRRLLRTVRTACKQADGVTCLTQQMLRYQQAQTGLPGLAKSLILPDSIDSWRKLGNHSGSPKPVFLYVGAFYGARRPEPLLKGFKQYLARQPAAELRIAGKTSCAMVKPLASRMGLSKNVTLLGQLADPKPAMCEADVLVSIEGLEKEPMFLPSKLLEYLGTDRIVLSIGPAGSPANAILNRVPQSAVACGHDIEEIALAMERAAQTRWSPALDQERRRALSPFTSEEAIPRLVSFLSAIRAGPAV